MKTHSGGDRGRRAKHPRTTQTHSVGSTLVVGKRTLGRRSCCAKIESSVNIFAQNRSPEQDSRVEQSISIAPRVYSISRHCTEEGPPPPTTPVPPISLSSHLTPISLPPPSLSGSCMIHGAAAWEKFHFVTRHSISLLTQSLMIFLFSMMMILMDWVSKEMEDQQQNCFAL